MYKAKREAMTWRGTVGKAVVAGAKDRVTNRVSAPVVQRTDMAPLQGFIAARSATDAKVYADDHSGYEDLCFDHEAVNHSAGEYVRGKPTPMGSSPFGLP